jgi:integrase
MTWETLEWFPLGSQNFGKDPFCERLKVNAQINPGKQLGNIMKLTQTALLKLSLPPDKSDAIFFDDELPGLGVRIRAGGSKKFVVDYRQGGLRRRHTLGSAKVLTLEEARRKARKILVAVDDGKDPAAEKAAKRAAAGLIFGAVVDDYLAAIQMRPRSLAMVTHHLKNHWKPLHKLPLSAVNRATVASQIRAIAKASGIVAANRARSALSAFYTWAIGEGLCESNPVIGTNTAGEETPRDRVLSDAELVAIWKGLPDSDYGCIVKLLMLTGQRRDEIGSLRWSEVDVDGKMIELPADRAKNGLPHRIPLSDEALAVLKSCIRSPAREYVFGDSANGFSGWSKAKARLDNLTGINEPWVLHDLRRTAATRMADLGVLPHIIEAALNHVSGHKRGVAGIYNKATYEPEKRAALELWANHIRAAVAK